MSSEPDNPPPGASSIDPETGRDRVGPLRSNLGDKLHDLQLMCDLAIVNAGTQAELGPLPPGGLPVEPKRKPQPRQPATPQAMAQLDMMEDEAMKLSHMAAVAAFGAAGTLAAACQPSAHTDGQGAALSETETESIVSTDATSGKQSRSAPVEETAAQSSSGAEYTDSHDNHGLEGVIKLGVTYTDLQDSLTAHGWMPARNRGKCRVGRIEPDGQISKNDPNCDEFPGYQDFNTVLMSFTDPTTGLQEVTNVGRYLFQFRRSSNQIGLYVVMEGDLGGHPDEEPVVIGWRFLKKDELSDGDDWAAWAASKDEFDKVTKDMVP